MFKVFELKEVLAKDQQNNAHQHVGSLPARQLPRQSNTKARNDQRGSQTIEDRTTSNHEAHDDEEEIIEKEPEMAALPGARKKNNVSMVCHESAWRLMRSKKMPLHPRFDAKWDKQDSSSCDKSTLCLAIAQQQQQQQQQHQSPPHMDSKINDSIRPDDDTRNSAAINRRKQQQKKKKELAVVPQSLVTITIVNEEEEDEEVHRNDVDDEKEEGSQGQETVGGKEIKKAAVAAPSCSSLPPSSPGHHRDSQKGHLHHHHPPPDDRPTPIAAINSMPPGRPLHHTILQTHDDHFSSSCAAADRSLLLPTITGHTSNTTATDPASSLWLEEEREEQRQRRRRRRSRPREGEGEGDDEEGGKNKPSLPRHRCRGGQVISMERQIAVENLSGAPRSIENILGEIQTLKLIIIREETLAMLTDLVHHCNDLYLNYGRTKASIIHQMPLFYAKKHGLLIRTDGRMMTAPVPATTAPTSGTDAGGMMAAGEGGRKRDSKRRRSSSNLLAKLSDLTKDEKAHSNLLLVCDKISEQVVSLQESLMIMLDRLRLVSLQVIQAIQAWRKTLKRCVLKKGGEMDTLHDALRWKDENYLLKMRKDLQFLSGYSVIRAWVGCTTLDNLSLPFLFYPDNFPSIDQRVQGYAKIISNALRESQVVKKKREARILKKHMDKVYGGAVTGTHHNSNRRSSDNNDQNKLSPITSIKDRKSSIPLDTSSSLADSTSNGLGLERRPSSSLSSSSQSRRPSSSSSSNSGGGSRRRSSVVLSMDTPPATVMDELTEEEDLQNAQKEYEEYQQYLKICIGSPHLIPCQDLLPRAKSVEEEILQKGELREAFQVLEREVAYEEMMRKKKEAVEEDEREFSTTSLLFPARPEKNGHLHEEGEEENDEEEGGEEVDHHRQRRTAPVTLSVNASALKQRQLSPLRPQRQQGGVEEKEDKDHHLSSLTYSFGLSQQPQQQQQQLSLSPTHGGGGEQQKMMKLNPDRVFSAKEKALKWKVPSTEDEDNNDDMIVVHRRLDGGTRNLVMMLEMKTKAKKASKKLEMRRRAARIKEVAAALARGQQEEEEEEGGNEQHEEQDQEQQDEEVETTGTALITSPLDSAMLKKMIQEAGLLLSSSSNNNQELDTDGGDDDEAAVWDKTRSQLQTLSEYLRKEVAASIEQAHQASTMASSLCGEGEGEEAEGPQSSSSSSSSSSSNSSQHAYSPIRQTHESTSTSLMRAKGGRPSPPRRSKPQPIRPAPEMIIRPGYAKLPKVKHIHT